MSVDESTVGGRPGATTLGPPGWYPVAAFAYTIVSGVSWNCGVMLQVKTFSLEAFGNTPLISSGPLASCTKLCSLREKRTPAPILKRSVNA